MTTYNVNFASMPWDTSTPGVRFKVQKQDGTQLRLVEFFREFVESDWCLRRHVGYLLEGELEIDFNGQRVLFRQGDGIFIPPGEAHKHKARVLTDLAKVILVEDARE